MSRPKQHSSQYRSEGFVCAHCGRAVEPAQAGTNHRNHCPHCLSSVHVDILPGDRRAACRGTMQPIAVWVSSKNEWSLIHRCERCGTMKSNRIAGDDDERTLIALALKPLSRLPFPIEAIIS